MSNSLKNAMAGSTALGSSTREDDADHTVCQRFYVPYKVAAGEDRSVHVVKCQTAIEVIAAKCNPAADSTANGTNHVNVGLGKGDQAAGALTAVGTTFDTSSTGFTERTERAFTIVTASDANKIAKGTSLYLTFAHDGSGVAAEGVLEVEYKLQN